MRNSLLVFLIGFVIIGSVFTQNCSVADLDKIDCAFSGINQTGCEARGCCWQPVPHLQEIYMRRNLGVDIPWCFYAAGKNPCGGLNFNQTSGPGFDQTFYDTMYSNFIKNIDMFGKGGVVAAPDNNTAGGSYFYDWMRDESLSMRSFMEINDLNLSQIQSKMNTWTQWVLQLQNEPDPNGIDVRIEPKFFVQNGSVFTGAWCRPQTDGPALRAAALIQYANVLLQNGQESYVRQYLWTGSSSSYNGGAIKFDLDWVVANWPQEGCDLWEEIRSDNFFWNRMAFQHALDLASTFAAKMGDSASSSLYKTVMQQIQATLAGHWTGKFMQESNNRQKDAAVIHAFSSLNTGNYYPFDSPYIAGTIDTLNNLFCISYTINQVDNNASIPGILYGRYQGDNYNGGNPWQLLTSVLGELFYQLANLYNQKSPTLPVSSTVVNAWAGLLKVQDGVDSATFAKAALRAGDAVLYRLYTHLKPQNGVVYEQINRNTGVQNNAENLTWSYANILRALHYRNTKLSNLTAF